MLNFFGRERLEIWPYRGLAIFQNGYAQVILGFFCAFCAVAAQLAVFQLVAVLNPKWQAASTGAVVLSGITSKWASFRNLPPNSMDSPNLSNELLTNLMTL